ncbi:polar amino acid ABC transporter inner membrane subunit [Thermincola ferriacetica]|uniref:Polar amino acid ABC transporter inner membrane subunit n=1 Tax=Thermincola ferriacetica TaxID=281456 RepID=A0A0L6W6C7_9FIRM|nr:amino acid ABC transporter permease [Thermincola ferriacetica]KNZ71075.1 polar amino acid ABC transporter inner membrane subunit [Thermincola ferriacetica]
MFTIGAIRYDIIIEYLPMLLKVGVLTTLELTIISVTVGTILGLFISLLRLSKFRPFSIFGSVYVDFFRGTPLLVQIFMIHFAILPLIIPGQYPNIISGLVALSLNSAAYVAEIFRAGIQSIDRGQMEAARSLGMTHGQAMRYVIIPQAFKRVIPALGNEFIAMLKDSSLVSAISVQELAMTGTIIANRTYRPFEPWIVVAILYLIMTLALSQIVAYLERRFGKSDTRS